jgi:hypothetical protein
MIQALRNLANDPPVHVHPALLSRDREGASCPVTSNIPITTGDKTFSQLESTT